MKFSIPGSNGPSFPSLPFFGHFFPPFHGAGIQMLVAHWEFQTRIWNNEWRRPVLLGCVSTLDLKGRHRISHSWRTRVIKTIYHLYHIDTPGSLSQIPVCKEDQGEHSFLSIISWRPVPFPADPISYIDAYSLVAEFLVLASLVTTQTTHLQYLDLSLTLMNAFWVRHLDRTFTMLPTSFYITNYPPGPYDLPLDGHAPSLALASHRAPSRQH